LEEAARECDIHVEGVLSHAPKLHVDMVVVVFVYQLEVLDGGFVNAAVEIQHKGLHLFIPLWWLVEEEHNVFGVVDLKLFLYRMFSICWAPSVLLSLQVYVW